MEVSGNLSTGSVSAQSHAITHTSHSLADDVMRVVQDASFTYENILDLFNDCLFELAGEFVLPDLERWADLTTTNTNTTPLPADYMRKLRVCFDITNNRKVKVLGSRVQIDRWFSNQGQTGRVLAVAPYQRNLYYQRIPSSSITLRVNYFAFPEKLMTRDDKPTCIPWHLAKPLLKNYALKELYSLIEDDINGQAMNTQRYETKYLDAKEKLFLFVGPEEREPIEFATEIDYDNYL
jgi:hypothetical protein